jgi:Holliday junction resolvase RusA-like endonuclease
MIIIFSVPGTPQPCQYRQTKATLDLAGRARGGVIYQNARTKTWQRVVGMAAMTAVRERCPSFKLGMYSGPVKAVATFWMPIPKSRIKDNLDGMPHLQKPDTTNLWKGLEDGLKHVLWADDCQVYDPHPVKCWTLGNPGAEIRIDLVEYE